MERGDQRLRLSGRTPARRPHLDMWANPILNWIFSVQTERTVAKDNAVAISDRHWQLEKNRFRSSLAGCTVTIHEHLDGTVSIRYGPHVVGRYTATGEAIRKETESRGKGGPV